jgi:hypothetical protein
MSDPQSIFFIQSKYVVKDFSSEQAGHRTELALRAHTVTRRTASWDQLRRGSIAERTGGFRPALCSKCSAANYGKEPSYRVSRTGLKSAIALKTKRSTWVLNGVLSEKRKRRLCGRVSRRFGTVPNSGYCGLLPLRGGYQYNK